jgi:tetrahydromethanopterin S-methyltransferase subunit F
VFWIGAACGFIAAWVLIGCLCLVYLIRSFKTWG